MRRSLPEPLPIHWICKSVESASTSTSVLDNGRLHIKICHEVIRGVTPEMLLWWFQNLEGDMYYEGRILPRYRVWHPRDHVSISYSKRADDGTISAGAVLHIREAFGRLPKFFVDVKSTIRWLGIDGFVHRPRWHGLSIVVMSYKFSPAALGTTYTNRLIVGFPGRWARVLNWLIRRFVFTEERARAWIKHNVEEVGNFEAFLPELYAAHHVDCTLITVKRCGLQNVCAVKPR